MTGNHGRDQCRSVAVPDSPRGCGRGPDRPPGWAVLGAEDDAAWSVPKGEYVSGEDPLDAAYREFEEEVGLTAPQGRAAFLGERRQPGGKRVSVWALEGDLDVTRSSSNTFAIEWPRGSGTIRDFPEVDRVEWVSIDQARRKLVKGQTPFLDTLLGAIAVAGRNDPGSTMPAAD